MLQAAGRLALERSGARVVGITGATGKTTTKDILVAMLRAAGVAAEGTPGNRNTEIGVPMSLMGLPAGLRGGGRRDGHARRRPDRRAGGARRRPTSRASRPIGPVHLELLGTVEAVAAAKAEILHRRCGPAGRRSCPPTSRCWSPHLAGLDPGVNVVRFGDAPDIDLDLSLSKAWELRNAAAALACCRALGAVPGGGHSRSRSPSRRCAGRSGR